MSVMSRGIAVFSFLFLLLVLTEILNVCRKPSTHTYDRQEQTANHYHPPLIVVKNTFQTVIVIASPTSTGINHPPHLHHQITSKEHFEDVVARAAGADEALSEGYDDANGTRRIPHKLLMVEIHAGWCRVCKGLQPKLLKLVKKHPEVLCCKINKTKNEVPQRIHVYFA